jgi:hypothetical protein
MRSVYSIEAVFKPEGGETDRVRCLLEIACRSWDDHGGILSDWAAGQGLEFCRIERAERLRPATRREQYGIVQLLESSPPVQS